MAHSDIAELSTIGAQLDEIAARVEAVSDRFRHSADSAVSNDLDLAERALIGARRAIARAARSLESTS